MNSPTSSVNSLLIAIIQSQDTDNACNALTNIKTNPIQLPSTGAFLGLKNTTLLLHSIKPIYNAIIQTLKLTCKQRIEYMPINVDGMMTPTGSFSTPIAVGGATIFSVDVEHFEEI